MPEFKLKNILYIYTLINYQISNFMFLVFEILTHKYRCIFKKSNMHLIVYIYLDNFFIDKVQEILKSNTNFLNNFYCDL